MIRGIEQNPFHHHSHINSILDGEVWQTRDAVYQAAKFLMAGFASVFVAMLLSSALSKNPGGIRIDLFLATISGLVYGLPAGFDAWLSWRLILWARKRS